MAASLPSVPDASRVSVPKLNKDPIQSLCPYPVEVTVAGLDFEIPALPAADWLSVLMAEDMDLSDVFPGLVQDADELEELILQGKVNIEEIEETVLGVIETVSARSWWVTLRLVGQARESWDVIGAELGLRGVDASKVSLSAWLDMLLILTIRAMEPKDVQMFCLKLEAPPQGTEVAEADMEMTVDQFMTMAG